MTHEMNLWHDSFTAIREQTKTIEMRLYDEKRSKIKIGDSIIFTDTSNGERIEMDNEHFLTLEDICIRLKRFSFEKKMAICNHYTQILLEPAGNVKIKNIIKNVSPYPPPISQTFHLSGT